MKIGILLNGFLFSLLANRMRIALIVFSLLIPVLGSAQGLKSKDYVVTKKGDTVYGFIQSLSNSKISLARTTDKSMSVRKYRVYELDCLVMKDTVYKGVKINPIGAPSTTVIMKLLLEGQVQLYQREIRKTEMWKPSEDQDFSGIMGKVLYREYYVVKGKKAFKVTRENFFDVCPQVFYDQDFIKNKFRDQKYKYQNLEQLVMDYNYMAENPEATNQ